MRFGALKEFKKDLSTMTIDSLSDYLMHELAATLRELRAGLNRLTFGDNFESFSESFVIAPLTEITIRNQFRTFIPSMYLITMSDEGGLSVCKGTTVWTMDFLYLKNTSATLDARVTVLFLK